jgi:hypothetical protein
MRSPVILSEAKNLAATAAVNPMRQRTRSLSHDPVRPLCLCVSVLNPSVSHVEGSAR